MNTAIAEFEDDILSCTGVLMDHDYSLNLRPQVLRFAYSERREQFLQPEERQENWLVFGVDRGRFRYKVGHLSGEASLGDIVFCPPGLIFRKEVLEPLRFYYFLTAWAGGEAGKAQPQSECMPSGKITIEDISRLTSTYSQLRKIAFFSEPFYMQIKSQLLFDIWCLHCLEQNPVHKILKRDSDDILMQEAKAYILENAFTKLNLQTLAASLELTPTRFSRQFRAAFGVNPISYLTLIRVHKAKLLLLETDDGLDTIARQVGYTDGFYLSRTFFKVTEMRPSEYRRLHQV